MTNERIPFWREIVRAVREDPLEALVNVGLLACVISGIVMFCAVMRGIGRW